MILNDHNLKLPEIRELIHQHIPKIDFQSIQFMDLLIDMNFNDKFINSIQTIPQNHLQEVFKNEFTPKFLELVIRYSYQHGRLSKVSNSIPLIKKYGWIRQFFEQFNTQLVQSSPYLYDPHFHVDLFNHMHHFQEKFKFKMDVINIKKRKRILRKELSKLQIKKKSPYFKNLSIIKFAKTIKHLFEEEVKRYKQLQRRQTLDRELVIELGSQNQKKNKKDIEIVI